MVNCSQASTIHFLVCSGVHRFGSKMERGAKQLSGKVACWKSQLGTSCGDVLDEMAQDEVAIDVHLSIRSVVLHQNR